MDAAVGEFDTQSSYLSYLGATAAFRIQLERRVTLSVWPTALRGWDFPSSEEAIRSDMADLALSFVDLPGRVLPFQGDQVFGALYVLLGASLGAQVLERRAMQVGMTRAHGARHLSLLANGAADWRMFLERLEAAEPFDLDAAIEGADTAFAVVQNAFEEQARV